MGVNKDGTYTLWDYELRTREINWKGDEEGQKRSIYFFVKKDKPEKEKSGKKSGIPDGYFVGLNKRTGLPYLTKDISKAYPGTPGVPRNQ